MKTLFNFLKKIFNHNYCDTCGLTKDKVYVVELYTEAGLIQCEKCHNQTHKDRI
jgi:predicted nucleic acid-binding Zn ribbon protein